MAIQRVEFRETHREEEQSYSFTDVGLAFPVTVEVEIVGVGVRLGSHRSCSSAKPRERIVIEIRGRPSQRLRRKVSGEAQLPLYCRDPKIACKRQLREVLSQ